jgi:transcription elongation factor Elf1
MKATKAVELLNTYIKCPQCGNDKVGDKEGSVEIHSDKFIRKCKCGWSIEVKEGE